MRRSRTRRIVVWMFALVMVIAAGSHVYANTYHEFRGDEIILYLPDEWVSEEIVAEDGEGEAYEEILYAFDGSETSALCLDVYYVMESVSDDDYIYFNDNEDAAMAYYAEYGKAALERAYADMDDAEETVLGEPTFFDGEWNGFIKIPISRQIDGTVWEETVYLTATMTADSQTLVHNILSFYTDGGTALTEDRQEIAKSIADEFYDYGYHDVMAGVSSEISWDSEGLSYEGDTAELTLELIFGVMSVIIMVAVIVIAVKKLVKRKYGNAIDAASPIFRKLSEKLSEVKEEEYIRNTETKKERKAERKSTMQMRNQAASDAERRYLQSLESLRRSGLLTKGEMHDMLERHQKSMGRQRKR